MYWSECILGTGEVPTENLAEANVSLNADKTPTTDVPKIRLYHAVTA